MSGVIRNSTEGKIDWLLVRDGPMFRRWAEHLSRAIPRTGKRNWMNASTPEDLARFRESAARHFEQWLNGEDDEDHAAAAMFNINGAEYTASRLAEQEKETH